MKTLLIVLLILFPFNVYANIPDNLAIRAIVGEASDQDYYGMYALASGLRARDTLDGVCGANAEHIDSEPQWVFDIAKEVWLLSKNKSLHDGAFWGSKIIDKKWLDKLKKKGYIKVYEYRDHVYYKKPN